MKIYPFILVLWLLSSTCQSYVPKHSAPSSDSFHADFTLAFGSGNNQRKPNPFWKDIEKRKPNVWIWEGDAIYSDTENMDTLAKNYTIQKNKKDYREFLRHVPVIGTWDDHDYGVNDGGYEYPQKKASQQLFLDFLDVPKEDIRRHREGVYYSKDYVVEGHKIKILLLDTRYFRTPLTKDSRPHRRYQPNEYGEGTMLGKAQWQWLQDELEHSDADFNVIMSSIQVLSGEHGFEAWGTMPHEIDQLEKIIVQSKAKGVFILSGDRHVSEVSRKNIGDRFYPLYDFTSSGLTHSYSRFSGEPNMFRFSPVVFQKSYGIVGFDFSKHSITFEMWGVGNQLLQKMEVQLTH